jgi:ribonuclease-3
LIFFNNFKLYFSKNKELSLFIYNVFGFYPKNISKYEFAFEHKSIHRNDKSLRDLNERLEYLGDAILDAIVADYLFSKFPQKDVGFLTEIRSRIVSRENLNKLSEKIGLDKYISINKDLNNVYRSIMGDTFEVLFATIYLERGYNFTEKVFINNILKKHIELDSILKIDNNYKSQIIEWAQKHRKTIDYKVVDTVNSGYDKKYIVEIFIDSISFGQGNGHSIKTAEKAAAEIALKKL